MWETDWPGTQSQLWPLTGENLLSSIRKSKIPKNLEETFRWGLPQQVWEPFHTRHTFINSRLRPLWESFHHIKDVRWKLGVSSSDLTDPDWPWLLETDHALVQVSAASGWRNTKHTRHAPVDDGPFAVASLITRRARMPEIWRSWCHENNWDNMQIRYLVGGENRVYLCRIIPGKLVRPRQVNVLLLISSIT